MAEVSVSVEIEGPRDKRANTTSSDIFQHRLEDWKWHDVTELSVVFKDHDQLDVPVEKQAFVTYVVTVMRGFGPDAEAWDIDKRYSQFDELNQQLKLESGVATPFPPKKMFGNKNRDFVAKRREGLQAYLQSVCAHPVLRQSLFLKRFLDAERYQVDPADRYHTEVSLWCRNRADWALDKRLGRIGWRYHKAVCLVSGAGGANASAPKVLTWAPLPQKAVISRELLGRTMHYLAEIVHPFIMPALCSDVVDSEGGAAVVIRELCGQGSLRDKIYGVKSATKESFVKKYGAMGGTGKGAEAMGLPARDVAVYGRQILEALRFLHEKGIPFGHLHSGNVVIKDDGACALTDLENGILGAPALYTPHITKLPKVDTLEHYHVYSFGHVLYEMALGKPLSTATSDTLPHSAPGSSVLQMLVSSEGVLKLPTISKLIQEPFFSTASASVPTIKPSFKASARVRTALKECWEHAEQTTTAKQHIIEQRRKTAKLEEEKRAKEEEREEAKVRKARKANQITVTK